MTSRGWPSGLSAAARPSDPVISASTCGEPVTQSTTTSERCASSRGLAASTAPRRTRSSHGLALAVAQDGEGPSFLDDVLRHAMAHEADADEADPFHVRPPAAASRAVPLAGRSAPAPAPREGRNLRAGRPLGQGHDGPSPRSRGTAPDVRHLPRRGGLRARRRGQPRSPWSPPRRPTPRPPGAAPRRRRPSTPVRSPSAAPAIPTPVISTRPS